MELQKNFRRIWKGHTFNIITDWGLGRYVQSNKTTQLWFSYLRPIDTCIWWQVKCWVPLQWSSNCTSSYYKTWRTLLAEYCKVMSRWIKVTKFLTYMQWTVAFLEYQSINILQFESDYVFRNGEKQKINKSKFITR